MMRGMTLVASDRETIAAEALAAIDGARGDEEILGVPVYGLWLEGEVPEE